jgi:hypothetical protein
VVCQRFVTATIIGDLIKSELDKVRERQDVNKLNLYINLLIDIAKQNDMVDRQMEKILLIASDMDVKSDYYYLAANLLRLKVS